jgi:protein SCO1/2
MSSPANCRAGCRRKRASRASRNARSNHCWRFGRTWLHRLLQSGGRFVFFSLDPAADTPARLKAYAEERGLDPADWSLYHGDDKAVRDLAAALGVRFRRDDKGGIDHSAAISLLDEKGEITFQKLDTKLDADEFVARIEALSPPSR